MPLSQKLNTMVDQTCLLKEIYQPVFYRLTISSDKQQLSELLKQKPFISVFDEIETQLKDLIRLLNPSVTFNSDELDKKVQTHIGGVLLEEYGVWVFYPWSNRLVHILDEKEFIEVRTNRNQNKITLKERELLASKKIGIIGLSVGQSVALTMAMERTFGELRIADFDLLDLTNLNRIRTGIHNLQTSKAITTAREIAEIDPFLKTTPFPEGISSENIEDFLLKDGKLDILIDECDQLDIKILCRKKAREFMIPVVMEASDRGTIDVERFDLDPNRPILHGLIDHLDISKLKDMKTNEEKVPYLIPFVGFETMSNRLRESMTEVGKTISTWPQLASAVTLGGGITADVCRRISLDQFRNSGRFFVDVEEIISDN
jgi:molybdopterin/thiamine biosynthesis adenylyltransferase